MATGPVTSWQIDREIVANFILGGSKITADGDHSIGEGNGNPLQCSCLENPMDGGAWWAVVYGVAQSDKESACNAGNLGSIPGLGRSPGKGNGNPLQYYCLENPMDRGAR